MYRRKLKIELWQKFNQRRYFCVNNVIFLSVHNDHIIFALESSKSELSLEWFCKFTDVFQS